jgi:DNA ligase-1
MLLHELVETSTAVAEASARLAKIDQLAALLRRVNPAEVDIAIAFLSGEPRQGRLGIGGSSIREAKPLTSAPAPVLQLGEVDEVFDRIAAATGRGSPAERVRLINDLLRRATANEQENGLGTKYYGQRTRLHRIEGRSIARYSSSANTESESPDTIDTYCLLPTR